MTTCEMLTGGAELFRTWERRVMDLYMRAFTTDAYAGHYLDETEERGWIRRLFAEHAARCHLQTDGATLAGFLLSADSGYDRRLPAELRAALAGEPARSIAELAVAPANRAQGLGASLVAQAIADAPPDCRNIIVRSNGNAAIAHRLYTRLGFDAFGSVRVPNAMIADGRRRVAFVDKQYFRYRLPAR
ncbi:GNAT family N-acetyltransferase [Burkholderia thailandensis]|uniref:Acetyltransferase family protein n=1 Tax=Burkholderia thailandensis TaxID=57975 RepID=A0AAW9CN52_BURTH|nr:GNAT family N-acetyltransferase [Burkholderia thailandensis]AHI67792.1 acetyltransferase family protein [Burkholderia thailandensis H0587]AIP64974.1 acetyltransferase [Burkholderia thailandensis]AOI54679.1 acetyltransferase [Burkholderia thailandensis]AOJ53934.1 acetyltransferase [Burkholderia thailandensis]AVR27924.1 N-acetyltransferase [Burkholderia thailandensis]